MVTGIKYGASKTDSWTWFAGTPFPAVNTLTVDAELISQAGTDNLIAHTTGRTTINTDGTPTVTVDTVRLNVRDSYRTAATVVEYPSRPQQCRNSRTGALTGTRSPGHPDAARIRAIT